MTSAIVQFYSGAGPDHRGRWLTQTQDWDDATLEAVHDYIQWLFPLPEASGFNPDAPLLTPGDIAEFREQSRLRRALLGSLTRMKAFYGISPAGPQPWLTPGNHNLLRLSRILRSLNLLGLEEEARSLLASLEALYAGGAAAIIGPVTLGYWRRAVQ